MSGTVKIDRRDGSHMLYYADGECAGKANFDTGTALLGDGFYQRDGSFNLLQLRSWAYDNMEGCNGPEWALYTAIFDAVELYLKETGI